ncbi:hypothetical protein L484_009017 [Morus notabilis]|uniref:Uncharacterized protein n=1 Tax=Morus notabilis TaxID=981085 RepID=W9RHL7_9ROSA|nr:uncharacterized protein LOC21392365 [Morus notabilis]EXB91924.1 hypothetical protein L484_009017 [Morus notabilis]
MGSLMSGWDSPVLSSKSGAYKRNGSLTKEEIETFWRSKQKTVEEHLKEITSLSDAKNHEEIGQVEEYSGRKFQKSSTFPLQKKEDIGNLVDVDPTHETSIDKLVKKDGWWTRSNWAFLNEPPVIEGAPNKYVSQFHVASLASSKPQARDEIATN